MNEDYMAYCRTNYPGCPYQNKGFTGREEYLRLLADEYEVDEAVVRALSSLLGPSEDFDGLVNELQDICNWSP